jgi:PKD repeat protein
MTINDLVSGAGSTLVLSGTRVIELVELTIDNDENLFTISSPVGSSEILINGHRRLCYDYFDISNVDLTGEATVSIGANSVTNSSSGWISDACEDVLFSEFSYSYACENSLVEFVNVSLGDYTSVEWTFDDQGISDQINPSFVFTGSGTFNVTLIVSDGSSMNSYQKEITLNANDLILSDISIVGEVLFSDEVADSYQWYKDNEIIDGATDRFYQYNEEEGVYYVVLFSETCNLPSNVLEIKITAITSASGITSFNIFPNPAKDEVIVVNNSMQEVKIEIISINGQVLSSVQSHEREVRLDISNVSPGLYFLRMNSQNETILRRIIVQ